MIEITIPTWLAIMLATTYILMIVHLGFCFGKLLSSAMAKMATKEKEKDKKEEKMKKCNMRQAEKTLNKIHNSSFEFIDDELARIEYGSFPSAKEMENLCLFFNEL